ncbi:MAG TPA: hypothetical protein VF185_00620 [Patescibacteria group bacterium]
MKGKGGIIGAIITLAIGGTVFTVSKTDIVKNFSKDTGLSQEESQQYVEGITEDDLVSYDKLGSEFISDGQKILSIAYDINCVDYSYKWETNTLSCEEGKSQLIKLGNDEKSLGNAYTILASKSASREDMSSTISFIDKLNIDFRSEVVTSTLDSKTIDEVRKTNSYNKALLQSALESK